MTGCRLGALGVGLLLATLPVQAQEARLYVSMDSVFVGERFTLSVTVEHPSGSAVDFPEVPVGDPEAGPLLRLGEAEVFEARRLPPRLDGAVRVDSIAYEATTFALDEAVIGPVVMSLVSGSDTTLVRTGTVTLPVRSVFPVAEAELLPPLPPEPFPSPWLVWALVTLGALLALALLVWAWRRFRSPPASLAPRLDPYPEATQRLGALTLPTDERTTKAYYIELAALVRTYLARSLPIPARELTTRELTTALETDPRLPVEAIKATRGTLRLADLVKFADLHPDAEAHTAARDKAHEAIDLIEAAIRPPEPEDESGEGTPDETTTNPQLEEAAS